PHAARAGRIAHEHRHRRSAWRAEPVGAIGAARRAHVHGVVVGIAHAAHKVLAVEAERASGERHVRIREEEPEARVAHLLLEPGPIRAPGNPTAGGLEPEDAPVPPPAEPELQANALAAPQQWQKSVRRRGRDELDAAGTRVPAERARDAAVAA